jgi:hypothetical protein
MKLSRLSIALSIVIQTLISCSGNDDDQQTGTNSTASGSTSNTSSETVAGVEAKEKKTDAAVQGLKGKVVLLSESTLNPGKSRNVALKNVFKYDEDGNRLELISYDVNGKIISNLKSTYVDGKISKEETILADGAVDVTSEITTDSKGNRIEQRDIKTNAVSPLFNYTHQYKYDEKGQMLERTALRGNGSLMYRYMFKYDNNGNRVEWIQIGASGLMVGRVTYKFNDKNNLIEEISYDGDNKPKATYTYTYEFDKKGNWKRRTKLENNTPVEIKERTYNYQ